MFNPYLPYPVRIKDIVVETEDRSLRTYTFEFIHEKDAESFSYHPGQFAELSIAGAGEVPIGIASSPTEGRELMFTVSRAGVVTTKLHQMAVGDVMGVRGPLGNWYPLRDHKGKDVFIAAGGYAVTTLRSTMQWLLHPDNRNDFGKITFVYGARTPGMLLYQKEIAEWKQRDDCDVMITVDKEHPDWEGLIGFVPSVCELANPEPENAIALICGPPVMIKFTQPVFYKCGWKDDQIFLSLENRMKCGIGICGRCNVGNAYVCKDGPVFTRAQLEALPNEY